MIIGVGGDFIPKPCIDSTLYVLDKFGLNNDEVLFVGDAETDLLTANNAKVDNVFVTWGYRSEKEIQNINYKYKINDALELIEIIEDKYEYKQNI